MAVFPRFFSNFQLKAPLVVSLFRGCLFFLTLGLVVWLLDYCREAEVFHLAWIDTHIKGQGAGKNIVFVFLVAVASAIGTPRQLLASLGGYAFGLLPGIFVVSVGLILGCTLDFFFARVVARSFIQSRLGNAMNKVERFLLRRPFLMAIAIRFLPVGNNTLTSLTGGVTQVPPFPFIIGSGVGYLPQTVVFAMMGSGVAIDAELQLALSFLLFIAASVIGAWLYPRLKAKAELQGVDPLTSPEKEE